MIDTIHIRINIIEHLIQGKDYIQGLLNVMTVKREGTNHITGTKYYHGKFKNLIIDIDGNKIAIKGSLAKYYNGNNLDFFSREDLIKALKMLSTELGLNVERGRLSRIDVADNLYLSTTPKKYVDLLIGIPRANAFKKGQTKYIERSCSTCVFYDKKKELYKKDVHTFNKLNKSGSNANVLRYEIRYERKLRQLFKVKTVKVALLHSTTFLNKLAEGWINQYQLITKVKQESYNEITIVSQFKKLIMFKGIIALGGFETVGKMIDDLKAINNWKYMPAYNLKQLSKTISNDEFLVDDLPLIEELDAAIADSDIVKYYIKH